MAFSIVARAPAAVATLFLGLLCIGSFKIGSEVGSDDLAVKMRQIRGQTLPTVIERDGIFVGCNTQKPVLIRLDSGGVRGRWVEVSPKRSSSSNDGLQVTWPRGRPGCNIKITSGAQGVLYVFQNDVASESRGISVTQLPVESVDTTPAPALLESPFSQTQATNARTTWADHLLTEASLTNSIGMELILVPPGSFLMGSNRHENNHQDDEFEHRVSITDPIYVSVFETKQSEFKGLMGYNPSHFQSDVKDAANHPVESVTWFEMVEFANRLSEADGFQPCYEIRNVEHDGKRIVNADVESLDRNGYRLPTEAEWEYFSRAGTTGRWYSGPVRDQRRIEKIAHIEFDGTPQRTDIVGSRRPNAFGLHDTIGNVWEWVQDWYDEDYYRKSPVANPPGPAAGRQKVIRGGSWNEPTLNARVPNRGKLTPYTTGIDRGFRVVRNVR